MWGRLGIDDRHYRASGFNKNGPDTPKCRGHLPSLRKEGQPLNGTPPPYGFFDLNQRTWLDVASHGAEMFKAVCKLGLEGIVSKRLDAPYRSGRPKSRIKVKNPKAPDAIY